MLNASEDTFDTGSEMSGSSLFETLFSTEDLVGKWDCDYFYLFIYLFCSFFFFSMEFFSWFYVRIKIKPIDMIPIEGGNLWSGSKSVSIKLILDTECVQSKKL